MLDNQEDKAQLLETLNTLQAENTQLRTELSQYQQKKVGRLPIGADKEPTFTLAVAERMRLELLFDLSKHLTAILDLDELLFELVNKVQEYFGYYQVHLYLVEPEHQDLVMCAGAGHVGQMLKNQGHRLKIGQGIVGMVAATNHHFVSNRVDDVENFVRNPILPHTQSELAVPLRKGGEVLGVLDIQSEQTNQFALEDISLMQAIADQTAIAIDNARLMADQQAYLTRLKHSRARARAIVDAIPMPVIVTHQNDNTIRYLNIHMENMFNISAKQMVGQPAPNFYRCPEDRTKLLADFAQYGFLHGYEIEMQRTTGETFWVSLSLHPMTFDGQPALFSAMYDITDRKQTEQMLAEYNQALETSSDISREITTIFDLNTLLQFVVNRINVGFNFYHTHIYLVEAETGDLVVVEGYGEVGKQLKAKKHRLKAGQGIVGTVAAINQHFLSNDVNQVDHFLRNSLLPLTRAELAVPMRKGKKVLGVLDIQSQQKNRFSEKDVALLQSIATQVAIAVDNARLLAEQKATIRKLKEVDRLKSQFLAMMSHELRTPMNAVLGFAELLMLGMSGDLSEQAQEDVQLIYDNGKHLLDLINDIIDISRIESGLAQISWQAVDVPILIHEVVAAAMVLLRGKPLKLITEAEGTLPVIQADPTRLKQILLNLVGNAIKFTAKGSVTIKANLEDEAIRFSVVDTGIGIPPTKQAEIFEAFNQADMTDTREYEGTGLGLTICKELVDMHNGTLGVISQEGEGSEFYFIIPLRNDNFSETVE